MANLRHVAFITPRLQTLGINHFGFTVDKLEEVMEKLDDSIEHGVNPQNGRPAEMRIIDPWRNNVDLSSRGFLGRDEFSLPGVRHVVVQADGPEACCRFYTDSCRSYLRRRHCGRLAAAVCRRHQPSARREEDHRPRPYPVLRPPGRRLAGHASSSRRRGRGAAGAPPAEAEEVYMKDPDGNVFALSTGPWLA